MEKPESLVKSDEVLSVSALSALLKGVVETAFARVKIRGEISGAKRAASGHIYFTLKDEDAVIDAVAWRGQNAGFASLIKDGLDVVVTGKITTYPMRSNYQIAVDSLEPAGEGALLKLLEELKKKLAAEGLFDAGRKKPIPYLPQCIGVVSSPTGAVIRDIIHRVKDRFPMRIVLWPCLVQGAEAAEKIAEAIEGFNRFDGVAFPRPDVLIVARGGGSIEDLWPFNEEVVVRAAANSDIPIISAVGHETDTTLIDYAADLRAPTPTGAAELATPVRTELLNQIVKSKGRIGDAINRLLSENQTRVEGLCRGIPNLKELVEMYVQRLDEKTERLDADFKAYIKSVTEKLGFLVRNLELCSYNRVLERGFALITNAGGKLVSSAKAVLPCEALRIKFADGEVAVTAGEVQAKKADTRAKVKPKCEDSQGDLFGNQE